jgi:hypothetical protein
VAVGNIIAHSEEHPKLTDTPEFTAAMSILRFDASHIYQTLAATVRCRPPPHRGHEQVGCRHEAEIILAFDWPAAILRGSKLENRETKFYVTHL